MTEALLVYVTTETRDDALALGRACVEARLAACANVIDGMRSVYRWQGAVEAADETVLVLKTRETCLDALTDLVRERHAYDCPCVVAVPIVGGNPDYLTWIAESCD
ncbi:MAG: divalent-cation tolerance protein CutA [Alphaproteobacteria bacterium]|jgi:periplasmic divalent cation tolerance protein|nr:divalent-cation tolerance protein CutA [Alphaproteobacteria bacterium]